MNRVQCIVAGAGTIGLATARKLSQRYETLILESCGSYGTQTSSRNSEVIHRGIYYKRNSLKALFCVESVSMMYDYLSTRSIPFNKCGKLIVATSQVELEELKQIHKRAIDNSVLDLLFMSSAEVRSLETSVECVGALYSPNTGIFDSYTFMQYILGDAEENGAMVVYNCDVHCVKSGEQYHSLAPGSNTSSKESPKFVVSTSQGDIGCDIFINACGLRSMDVANCQDSSIHPRERVPQPFYLKGNYFKYCGGKQPFSRLVYPCPDKATGALGVHATIDMGGSVKFGPDAVWISNPTTEAAVDSGKERVKLFEDSIRRYYPSLRENCLQADYAGVRPKLVGPGMKDADILDKFGRDLSDFVIEGPASHGGASGLVNLYGIESPGLTCSLRIADHVHSLIYK